ncbi:DUF4255 domain-containing protein [Mesorhizobium japonicum]|uniref:Mlr6545 protein n=1 Tax=Mesorhizobium japonicum (strain LMG 29417 / CECT 9101 / MAFF 303099) TaxID=266835 RepID=Q988Y1_RHILO|nr:DUF4255 domain-containing protein [Mesorhizobium japonicum]BAB52816.1 mlr6545 [Mesorhizobium japonicum MAFF 303099]
MSADSVYNVTQAVRDRLVAALATIGEMGNVFVGPLDDPDARGATLILFLYRMAPNASLRNREHRVISRNPPQAVDVYTNSLPLELHYLITVGTRDATVDDPLLKYLGAAIQALNNEPELNGQRVGHEPVHLSFEPLSTEEMSRIWTLFPTANYRTSVGYMATPVWIDPPRPEPESARVVEDELVAGHQAREVEDA